MAPTTAKPIDVARTTAPGRYVLLYDGHCKFCSAQMANLLRLAKPGSIEPRSFHDPGALDPFPGITHEQCMDAMHLVTPDGRIYRGFEAAVRALGTRRVLGKLALVYYVPPIRQLCDAVYRLIARYRYRIMGRAVERGECDDACAVHFTKKP